MAGYRIYKFICLKLGTVKGMLIMIIDWNKKIWRTILFIWNLGELIMIFDFLFAASGCWRNGNSRKASHPQRPLRAQLEAPKQPEESRSQQRIRRARRAVGTERPQHGQRHGLSGLRTEFRAAAGRSSDGWRVGQQTLSRLTDPVWLSPFAFVKGSIILYLLGGGFQIRFTALSEIVVMWFTAGTVATRCNF